MAKPDTYSWQGGGTYMNGKCDVEGCDKSPNYKLFYSPSVMNGDDECVASACREHFEKVKDKNSQIEFINKTTDR